MERCGRAECDGVAVTRYKSHESGCCCSLVIEREPSRFLYEYNRYHRTREPFQQDYNKARHVRVNTVIR